MSLRLSRLAVCAAAFCLLRPASRAQYLYESFVEPSWIATEEPNAEFSQWDDFYRANGTNFPDMDAPFGVQSTASAAGVTPPATTSASDPANPVAYWNNNNPTITQTAGGAFIIGPAGGNVYSFSNPTAFRLNDSTPYAVGTVVFQFQTEGSLFDPNSLRLVYNPGGGNISLAPADIIQEYAVSGSPFGGLSSRAAAQWNISGLGISTYQIVWNASASSMSFQRALLDTTSISGTGVPRSGNFTGASSVNWASAANWNGGLLPDDAANVRLLGGSSVTLDASRMVALVTFATPGNFTLNAAGGAVLTVNTGFTATNAHAYTVNAPVQFGGYQLIDVGAGSSLDFQNSIGGISGFQKNGLGMLLLHANNTFGGGVTLSGGTLEIFGNNTYANGTYVANGSLILHQSAVSGSGGLGSGFAPVALGVVDSVGTDAQLWLAGDLSMVRNVNVAAGTDAKTLGARSTSSVGATFNGSIILDNNADNLRLATQSSTDVVSFSGSMAGGSTNKTVHITGPGTVVYSGSTKTYSSATSVDTGALKLAANTSFTGTGAFSVASGAQLFVNGNLAGGGSLNVAGTLRGTGTVQRATTLSAGAALAPGSSGVGTLTFGSSLTLTPSTHYYWELQYALLTPGTGWDTIQVNGALAMNSTALQPLTVHLLTLDAGGSVGMAVGFNPTQSYDWIIAQVLGGVTSSGFFAIDELGFMNPTPGSFSLSVQNNQYLVLHYAGAAIPEPAHVALWCGLAGLLFVKIKRQRSKS